MTTTITVEGMSCDHCEDTVEDALQNVPGVTDATVDRTEQQAAIEGDVDIDALLEAVTAAGYSAHA